MDDLAYNIYDLADLTQSKQSSSKDVSMALTASNQHHLPQLNHLIE